MNEVPNYSEMILSEFLNLFKQGKVSAHSHMKNLLEMALADGHYDNSEDQLLKSIASKHGVSSKKLIDIQQSPEKIEFIVPDNAKEKFNQFFDLVHMMVIDEDVDREELRLCVVFAKKFGYDPDRSEELVESVASNISSGNSLEETRKRVEWML